MLLGWWHGLERATQIVHSSRGARSRGAVCAHAVPTSLTPASLWQTPASWQDHYSEHAMRCGKNCGLNPDPAFRKDVRAPH